MLGAQTNLPSAPDHWLARSRSPARVRLRPTSRRGRAWESAPQKRRASAVDGRGVLGRWGLGPDGERAPLRARTNRLAALSRPEANPLLRAARAGTSPAPTNFAQVYRREPLKNASHRTGPIAPDASTSLAHQASLAARRRPDSAKASRLSPAMRRALGTRLR